MEEIPEINSASKTTGPTLGEKSSYVTDFETGLIAEHSSTAACGKGILQVKHLIPVCRGTLPTLDHLQAACKPRLSMATAVAAKRVA